MTITSPVSTPSALDQLSDRDLLAQIRLAAQAERQATAHLIALLVELDARRLYLGEGFSSLFTYCTQALHLSESAAYNRIETARAARRFPIILDLIGQGVVTLTAVRLLAPHLTAENHHEVLESARHKSKRDVELLVARLHPQPDVPASVRKLPITRGREQTASVVPPAGGTGEPAHIAEPDARSVEPPQNAIMQRRPPEVKPLATERYRIQFTVSRDTYDMLRCAQDLLRHSVPDGDPAVIFERAITLLVTELEKRKTAATDHPRAARSPKVGSRQIPAAVKRIVWERDGGRCTFTGANGRCSETGFLEYHHVVPFAAGGESTARNVELRCRAHNQYEAERYFGRSHTPLLRERPAWYGSTAACSGTS